MTKIPFNIIDAKSFEAGDLSVSIDSATLDEAEKIVTAVRRGGESAIRQYARQFNERTDGQPLLIGRDEMEAAAKRINHSDVELLRRVAHRIGNFADAQLECLTELEFDVPGGQAGHTIEPIARVGCYAPAGRFALPSTVLMTVVPAMAAGCGEIILATPNPSDLMLATAAVAGADRVLAVGGAHAIAAMAYGFDDFERCSIIAGPGNRWVTAAKKIVSGDCGIDMLAGPSELVLIADESANVETVAADLLAQAEHDVDARPFLITTSRSIAEGVVEALIRQINVLPTGEVAKQSLANGAAIVAESMEDAIEVCNALAPEHLELHCENADDVALEIENAGCIFIGSQSAEVFGDYGIGPNHTLPTAGTSRWSAGLNVFSFIRVRTWIKLVAAPKHLIEDTARLAELEGLFGHQRAGLRRLKD
jgi:phosphoribosyl-ATP pyrophosphohydrolase/phosphoribosyl-AMP cyclohydrolase/histidinol dehydrogenase